MLKYGILSVLLLTPTVGAQEETLIVERALRISVVGTIVDTPRELHLTKDHEAKITSLRTHHYTVYSEAVRASYDGVPGQKVTGELLEVASRVTDPFYSDFIAKRVDFHTSGHSDIWNNAAVLDPSDHRLRTIQLQRVELKQERAMVHNASRS